MKSVCNCRGYKPLGLAVISMVLLSTVGCTVVGPSAIRSGRLAYNEAIIETSNQQMLMVAVGTRYSERTSMLAVASVTANVRVRSSVGLELGFGSSDSYEQNLVPFGAGVIYEENPTISYVPVGGEKYVSELMSPLPISTLAQFTRNLTDAVPIYTALTASINGMNNLDFAFPEIDPDPRFDRFTAIATRLNRAKRLHWVEDKGGSFSIIIDQTDGRYAAEVSEFMDILGLRKLQDDSLPYLTVPVVLGLDSSDKGQIGIVTRSVIDLLEILTGAVEIPENDQTSGAAKNYPPPGRTGKDLRVRYTPDKPVGASVAVNYRDGWFSIDDKDQATKNYFRLLSALWSVSIASSNPTGGGAPVLTVPVSR